MASKLTLALLVFCRGTAWFIFPCTSLEIGDKSAASNERSSKSPSSSFLALPENGHSPDIFSSFSLAQNIFTFAKRTIFWLLWCIISFQMGTDVTELLRSLGGPPSSRLLIRIPSYSFKAQIQIISTKSTARERIQYSLGSCMGS
ncbi:hypothetical protein GOODEAATRI_010216 [Goodea atripinnis]|uniref:Secreted protein n=1 Tax=Goodea atripinnis TaxID=208336 RepID=A0ABV0NCM9_9TELE